MRLIYLGPVIAGTFLWTLLAFRPYHTPTSKEENLRLPSVGQSNTSVFSTSVFTHYLSEAPILTVPRCQSQKLVGLCTYGPMGVILTMVWPVLRTC